MTTFGKDTTTDDVLAGIDLSGRRVVITGAASGLGRESARAMASRGALVTVAARSPLTAWLRFAAVLVAGGIPAGMQLGLAVGILSAFLTALLSTLNKRHIGDGSALALTFVQIGAGAIFVALGMYLLQGSESLTTLPAGEDLLWLLLLAVVCTLLPYVLWLRALRHISAFATQLALNLEPVYAILIAALWFREDRELTVSFYVGVLIILSAVALQPLLRRIDRR
jgi:drug/metabolite transporter (DMT)-like permease